MNFITPRWLNAPRQPAPQNYLWSHLRHAGEPLSIADLVQRTDIDPVIVTRWLRKWRKAGLIDQVGRQALLKMNGFAMRLPEPPVDLPSKPLARNFQPSSTRQRIWTAVRVLKVFELPMLLITAEACMGTALRYLGELVRAGYLERIDVRGAAHRKYRLVLDTGPHHPATSRVVLDDQPYTRVIDHNNGAQLHLALGRRGRSAPPAHKNRPAPASPFFDRKD